MNKPIKLGERYKDPLTGCEGVAVCRTAYLYGCARVGLQGVCVDGKIPDPQYIDELQLVKAPPDKTKGGPRPDPPMRQKQTSRGSRADNV